MVSTGSKIIRITTLVMIIIGLATVVLTTFAFMLPYAQWLNIVGFCTAGYFSFEYLLRLREALRKRTRGSLFRYQLSFMGVVDLLAILPFIVPLFFDVESAITTMGVYCRLVLIFKLRRYSGSFDMLSAAVNSVRRPLLVAISLPLMFAVISALFFFYIEAPLQPEKLQNVGDAFYWVIITMTTVGYGDITPISQGGHALAILTALSGVMIIAIPSGLLSSAFMNQMRTTRTNKSAKTIRKYSMENKTRALPSEKFKIKKRHSETL